MRLTLVTSIAALALLAAGCTPKAPATNSTGSTTGGTTSGTPEKPAVPASLQHDGFAFYGLGSDKQLVYNFENMEGAGASEGSLSAALKSADKDKAVYSIERTGALTQLGSEMDEVRADGIYTTEMSLGTLKAPVLTMPANPKVGDKWQSKMEVQLKQGGTTIMEVTNTVSKMEKVKVPAGEYDALLVISNGTLTQGEIKAKISSKVWYAKNVGIVQLRLESTKPDGQAIKQNMVLTSQKDKEK